jgi:Fe-S cluster assembly scaffold protein SufB
MTTEPNMDLREGYAEKYGFHDSDQFVFKIRKGLDRTIVEEISKMKKEPQWMTDYRLKAYEIFGKKPMPNWGADLSTIDFQDIYYYVKPTSDEAKSWDDVPADMKRTFDKLGIPEAEQKFLSGVGAQYDSEVVYHKIKESLEKQGVIFLSADQGLRDHEALFKQYFGTVIPSSDNKFAALNSAVWSGGSFIYVPKGVKVDVPLQAYFRINTKDMGQFERTLIIVDEGAYVHYVEGCTAPIYSSDSLHSAVVEIIVKKGGRCRYTTIQNWSNNVYNLVTKRAVAYENATMEWVDGNLGCLTGDAGVMCNNDVRPISSIEPGDHVYSLDAEMKWDRREVLAKKYSGRQQVFRLRTENHREVRATANHPFLALTKAGRHLRLEWKRLDQLEADDHVAISGSLPDHGTIKLFEPFERASRHSVRIPSESSTDLLWLLGFYIGDGYPDGDTRVCFAVPETDKSFTRVMDLLTSLFGVEGKVYKNVIRVNSAKLRDWILSIGFSGGAHGKRIPGWVFKLPHDQRIALIEGYVAADGHRRANHKNLSITSVNRPLLEDVKSLAISCGLDPRKISKWSRKELKPLGKEEKEYTHFALYFGEKAYDTPLAFSKVSSIAPEGIEDTWDIEVEGSHNFVANGLVVHNSKITMKYPAIYMMEPGAHGEVLSIAFAGKGQHTDAGAKAVHCAPNTTSKIISKSISKDGGRAGYRGLVKVVKGATNCRSTVNCDALILDEESRSDTYPYMEIEEDQVTIGHEATVSKIGDEQIFYLTSRGIPAEEAAAMIVAGFIEPIVKELPMEYAVEMNRLIQLQMEGSVG